MTERNTALFDEIADTIERIPWEGLSVPDALRAIAAGATYDDVTGEREGATVKPLSEVKRLANEAVAASNGASFGGGASDV